LVDELGQGRLFLCGVFLIDALSELGFNRVGDFRDAGLDLLNG